MYAAIWKYVLQQTKRVLYKHCCNSLGWNRSYNQMTEAILHLHRTLMASIEEYETINHSDYLGELLIFWPFLTSDFSVTLAIQLACLTHLPLSSSSLSHFLILPASSALFPTIWTLSSSMV